jgi:hypothetical protein
MHADTAAGPALTRVVPGCVDASALAIYQNDPTDDDEWDLVVLDVPTQYQLYLLLIERFEG